eukprot:Sspe_Gene.93865::Locus_66367_Transcript_1_1_Confidence_1.000_Length_2478::g.93865::m.93865
MGCCLCCCEDKQSGKEEDVTRDAGLITRPSTQFKALSSANPPPQPMMPPPLPPPPGDDDSLDGSAEWTEVRISKPASELLGLSFEKGEHNCLIVSTVANGTIAQKSGLEQFLRHKLTHVNGHPVSTLRDVHNLLPSDDGEIALRFSAPACPSLPPPPLKEKSTPSQPPLFSSQLFTRDDPPPGDRGSIRTRLQRSGDIEPLPPPHREDDIHIELKESRGKVEKLEMGRVEKWVAGQVTPSDPPDEDFGHLLEHRVMTYKMGGGRGAVDASVLPVPMVHRTSEQLSESLRQAWMKFKNYVNSEDKHALDELVDHLHFPEYRLGKGGVRKGAYEAIKVLCEGFEAMHSATYPSLSKLELLLLALCPMEKENMDYLLGHSDGTHSSNRNILAAIAKNPRPLSKVASILLSVTTSQHLSDSNNMLYGRVASAFKGLEKNHWVGWAHPILVSLKKPPSPGRVSTSQPYVIIELEFANGAPHGIVLSHISCYPDEQEVLLPAFTIFKVVSIHLDDGTAIVHMQHYGHGALGSEVEGFASESMAEARRDVGGLLGESEVPPVLWVSAPDIPSGLSGRYTLATSKVNGMPCWSRRQYHVYSNGNKWMLGKDPVSQSGHIMSCKPHNDTVLPHLVDRWARSLPNGSWEEDSAVFVYACNLATTSPVTTTPPTHSAPTTRGARKVVAKVANTNPLVPASFPPPPPAVAVNAGGGARAWPPSLPTDSVRDRVENANMSPILYHKMT